MTPDRARTTGERAADLLVRLGAAVFALGLLATVGVLLSHDLDVLDRLLPVALALVPIGFAIAFGGLVLLVRGRASGHHETAG